MFFLEAGSSGADARDCLLLVLLSAAVVVYSLGKKEMGKASLVGDLYKYKHTAKLMLCARCVMGYNEGEGKP